MIRTLADVRRDMRAYYDMLAALEEIGDWEGAGRYRLHAAAIQQELEQLYMLRRERHAVPRVHPNVVEREPILA